MKITYSKLLALLILIIFSSCKEENVTPPPAIESNPFIKSYGKERSDRSVSVKQDIQGNFWIAGYSISYSGTNNDIILMKCNPDGSLIWAKSYTGSLDDNAAGMQLTHDGGCIIIGTTNSYGSIGSDIHTIKVDIDGNLQWSKIYKLQGNDFGFSITITTDGGYIVSGATESQGAGNLDALILKLDAQGLIMWGYTYGGVLNENAIAVSETNDQGFILSGVTYNAGINGDILILKAFGDGVLNWAKSFGGGELDEPTDLLVTSAGSYIISGFTTSFGLSSQDGYFLYLDNSGEIIRSYAIGGFGQDNIYTVRQTSDLGFIACGSAVTGSGTLDAFIIKFYGDFQYNWSRTIGLQGNEEAVNITERNGNNLLAVGYTSSIGAGENDIYLMNLNSDGTGCYTYLPENFTANDPLTVTNNITELIISNSLSDYDSAPVTPFVSDIILNLTDQCISK